MLKKILLSVVAILAALMIFAALKSPDYMIQREVTIHAPANKIFPYLNNSQKSNLWMPWKETDPTAEMHYTGPKEGVGSTASWDSKGRMGTGQAVISQSIPNKMVTSIITYTSPMSMTQMSEMSLTPGENGIVMRWTVSGKNSFVGRFFCMFSNMEKMVGPQFEKGLNNLKQIVEAK